MKNIPQTKGNALISELTAKKNASTAYLSPDNLSIAKIHKQIKEVSQIDPIEGWSLECVYQAALGNADALTTAKKKFILLNGTGVPLFNVAVALSELGLFSDCVDLLKHQINPYSGYFTPLIPIAFCSGMFEELSDAYDMIQEKGIHLAALNEKELDLLQSAKENHLFLKKHGLKTEHCTQLLDIAGLIVRKNQCRIVRNSILDMLDDDEGQQQLNFFLYLTASSDICFQMNSNLIEKIEASTILLENNRFIDVLFMQKPITTS